MRCPECRSTHIRKSSHRRGKPNPICVHYGRQFIDDYTVLQAVHPTTLNPVRLSPPSLEEIAQSPPNYGPEGHSRKGEGVIIRAKLTHRTGLLAGLQHKSRHFKEMTAGRLDFGCDVGGSVLLLNGIVMETINNLGLQVLADG
jgi:hypothetical protein